MPPFAKAPNCYSNIENSGKFLEYGAQAIGYASTIAEIGLFISGASLSPPLSLALGVASVIGKIPEAIELANTVSESFKSPSSNPSPDPDSKTLTKTSTNLIR